MTRQSVPRSWYEVIVVDNNSRDATCQVVREFEGRTGGLVRLATERRIQSAYAARNTGVRAAKGNIVALTDSDCVPLPDWLEKGFEYLENSKCCFVAGRIEFTFQSRRPNIWEYFDTARKLDQRAYVEKAGFGATANLFIPRQLFDKHGLFRSELESGGDYEFGRRLTRSGERLIYAEDAVVLHPARGSLKTILQKSKRIAKGQKQLGDMGLLEHGTISWRRLRPELEYPTLDGISLRRNSKVALILIANFFKYYNIVRRL
jgi:glycosyltransferase involved in cell wall biosynthesis